MSKKKTALRWMVPLVILTGLLFGAQFAQASPVLYPTGVDDSFVALIGGSQDTHYTMTGNGNVILNGAPAVAISNSTIWWQWVKPTDARWIYNADLEDSGIRGTYDFQTTFNLTGYNPATASISGKWAADQYGSIFLNGIATGISLVDGNWDGNNYPDLHSFTISSGFLPGINTLTFRVDLPDGGDGLLVRDTSVTANAVPVPPALLLFGSGLIGLAGLGRRFRKS